MGIYFSQLLFKDIQKYKEYVGAVDYFLFDTKCKTVGGSGQPELAEEGICQIISGLFKKIVIADRIQPYVSTIFASYESYPAAALWLALFLNACYIYCDFAGYSEIAIGVTKLFGLTAMKPRCVPSLFF